MAMYAHEKNTFTVTRRMSTSSSGAVTLGEGDRWKEQGELGESGLWLKYGFLIKKGEKNIYLKQIWQNVSTFKTEVYIVLGYFVIFAT